MLQHWQKVQIRKVSGEKHQNVSYRGKIEWQITTYLQKKNSISMVKSPEKSIRTENCRETVNYRIKYAHQNYTVHL
jgi:hypothetical protein